MNNLAEVLQKQGDFEGAEALYRHVLQVTRDRVGADHPATLIPLNNVARVIHDQGKLDEAIPLLRETVDAFTRIRGPEHPQTIAALGNLAAAIHDSGDLDEAARLSTEAVRLYRKVLGERHPSTLGAWHNLASIYVEQGLFDKAEAEYRRIIATAEEVFPKNHWIVSLFHSYLGKCLTGLERYAEAETELRMGVEGIRAVFGADHQNTLKAQARLNDLYEVWQQSPAKNSADTDGSVE